MKNSDVRQLELGGGLQQEYTRANDDELMRRVDKIINDTTRNVRPYLNRMVKDVERLLEGSFIRTPSSTLLDDMVQGLEKDIRKFVQEVRALKRWSQPNPPDSSSNHLR
ncbi:MAG: hypothetical protein C4520_01390 [Candidatus Abyssobacteria bacterium SURF_5]|uniref:Uncharacterized protein n=1 Tax=Abyssobacteria bacterium (strain SURF_5) TaxID=2093360 RepID=A0A3A4P6A1_ABYX5|nr:MAG: hypothetical protein C4520_01390 [Candidatus Abyssubacteria bacterium SURF_5]